MVAELAAGLAAVCFVGDDTGDLPAFEALRRLAAAGVATLAVAVAGPETPAAVLAAADMVVDGPAGLLVPARGPGRPRPRLTRSRTATGGANRGPTGSRAAARRSSNQSSGERRRATFRSDRARADRSDGGRSRASPGPGPCRSRRTG